MGNLDTQIHMNRNENICYVFFFGNLVELFQAHIKVNSVFSQCHAGSSHGRGHSGGKYAGDTQTNKKAQKQ